MFGRSYGGLVDTYRADDAEVILVAMGSVVGTARDVVDDLRVDGLRAGLVKVRCYRPFPAERLLESLSAARAIAVLDQSISNGSQGPLALDVRGALYNHQGPPVAGFVGGLGGREIRRETIRYMLDTALRAAGGEIAFPDCEFLDLNREVL